MVTLKGFKAGGGRSRGCDMERALVVLTLQTGSKRKRRTKVFWMSVEKKGKIVVVFRRGQGLIG